MVKEQKGRLEVVAKTGGIKLNIAGVTTAWINPAPGVKEEILANLDKIKVNQGKTVIVGLSEDNKTYKFIYVVDEEPEETEEQPVVEEEVILEEQKQPEKEQPQQPEKQPGASEPKEPEETEETWATQAAYITQQPIDKEYFKKLNKKQLPTKKIKTGFRELTYVSWADAWEKLKEEHPDANYTIYENKNGLPYFYDHTGAFVKVAVTVQGIKHTVFLPVMDHANRSIPTNKITSFDVNKTIQRALTKAIAMHGLGLFAYRGEDTADQEGN